MEKFKVGDKVRVIGHPFIKDDTRAVIVTLCRLEADYWTDCCGIRFDDYWFKVKFGSNDTDYLICEKYLEKAEDWLHFETTNRDSEPLLTRAVKLQKEIVVYNCMYQWKQKFDPVEVNWENNEEGKVYITKNYGDWDIFHTFGLKQNLQVYFTTKEKAKQCLEWLKKEGVLY